MQAWYYINYVYLVRFVLLKSRNRGAIRILIMLVHYYRYELSLKCTTFVDMSYPKLREKYVQMADYTMLAFLKIIK
jgi:hypothetical protein